MFKLCLLTAVITYTINFHIFANTIILTWIYSREQSLRFRYGYLNVFCGAGNEARTRDPQLGKLMLYQLSYSRLFSECKDSIFLFMMYEL